MSGWLTRKNTNVLKAASRAFLQFAMISIARNIQNSNVTPVLSNEVFLKNGTVRKTAVATADRTASMMTFGHVMFIPPKSLSTALVFSFFFVRSDSFFNFHPPLCRAETRRKRPRRIYATIPFILYHSPRINKRSEKTEIFIE